MAAEKKFAEGKADGMIIGLMRNTGSNQEVLRTFFRLGILYICIYLSLWYHLRLWTYLYCYYAGCPRYYRLLNNQEKRPKGGANGRQVTEDDRAIIHSHINSLDFEVGFPCSHCKQKSYIRDTGKNWTSLYKEYVEYHKNSIQQSASSTSEMITSMSSTVDSITTTDDTIQTLSSRRKKQRLPGEPILYDTWRQLLKVVYSHVTFQK